MKINPYLREYRLHLERTESCYFQSSHGMIYSESGRKNKLGLALPGLGLGLCWAEYVLERRELTYIVDKHIRLKKDWK